MHNERRILDLENSAGGAASLERMSLGRSDLARPEKLAS